GEESENLVQAVIDQFMAEANQAGTIDNTVQEASFQRVIGVDKRMSGIPDSTNSRIVSIHFLRKWGWAAASILLLLAGAAYWWNSDRNSSTTNYTAKTEEIVPGSEGAILTLADGSTMI